MTFFHFLKNRTTIFGQSMNIELETNVQLELLFCCFFSQYRCQYYFVFSPHCKQPSQSFPDLSSAYFDIEKRICLKRAKTLSEISENAPLSKRHAEMSNQLLSLLGFIVHGFAYWVSTLWTSAIFLKYFDVHQKDICFLLLDVQEQ